MTITADATTKTPVKAVIPPDHRSAPAMKIFRATRVWLVLAAAAVIWEVAVTAFDVPKYLFPAPSAIIAELQAKPDLYLGATLTTTIEAFLGFVAAVVIGVIFAVLIARAPLFEELVFPFLNIIRVTPTVAIAPLLTIWFGRGMVPVVIASFLIAFFPIIVQTVLGLKSVDRGLID